MQIERAATVASGFVRDQKEFLVAKAKGACDLGTLIVAYRGDDPVATLMHPPDRDEMLRLAHMMAGGFSADLLTVSFETYQCTTLEDPRTGKRWGPGAMHSYVDEHGPDNGLVFEALMTSVVNRADDLTMIRQAYVMRGLNVKWLKEDMPDPARVGHAGTVPDALRYVMRQKSFDQAMTRIGALGMTEDPEMERASMDMVAAMHLRQSWKYPQTELALAAENGGRRAKLFKERLGSKVSLFQP